MSDHISVEELADAAEGLLAPARADQVRNHLAGCALCADTAGLLASVTTTLAAQPAPAMPPAVAARLDAVLAQEQSRREAAAGGSRDGADGAQVVAWTPRPHLEPPRPLRHQRGHAAGWVLLAATVATAVGFGGYVLSARAGLNEPPDGAAALSSGDLRQQAGSLEASGDIDAHRFSRAWSCARKVTDGRITGLASVTLDGSPALLAYVRTPAGQQVAVIEGCDDGSPRVTATSKLSR
ncbi:hypothetical protein [Microlunatus ginsengisoli]|uniref:Zinc-finger n=1 Tax=Microlunatus ginsengisoli TaxID=363863 RepID=A0ABP6ZXY6_9ACTN